MKKQAILLCAILFFVQFSNAQFGIDRFIPSKEDLKTLKEVPLLVLLWDETNQESKDYNASLKEAMDKEWKYSKEIKYIFASELETYETKQNFKKYAVYANAVQREIKDFKNIEHRLESTAFIIRLLGVKKQIHHFMTDTPNPNTADMILIAQQIQSGLNSFDKYDKSEYKKTTAKSRRLMMQERTKLIKEKTLLIDKENISDKAINRLEKKYKYAYKIVSKEEIDKAILEKDSNVAFLKIYPVGQKPTMVNGPTIKITQKLFTQYFFDASNGELITLFHNSGVQFENKNVDALVGQLK